MIDVLFIGPVPTSINEVGAAGPYLLGECRAHGLTARYLDANMHLFNLCMRNPDLYNAKVEALISMKYDETVNQLIDWISDKITEFQPKVLGVNVFSSLSHNFAAAIIMQHPKVVIGGVGANRLFADSGKPFAEQFKDLTVGHQTNDGISEILRYLKHDTPRGQFTPDYTCYDLDQYCWDNGKRLPMMTSRGCVRRCSFCDVPSHWPTFTWQDPKDVVRQMVAVHRDTGVKVISFNDSLVNGNLKNFETLLESISAAMDDGHLPRDLSWSGTYIIRRNSHRLSRIHELMGKTNARGMTVGIESGSDKIRFEMEKKFTNDDLAAELAGFAANGVSANLLFFPSWPTETEDDFNDTLALLTRLSSFSDRGTIDTLGLGQLGFMLLDGTPIWERRSEIELKEGPNNMLWTCGINPDLTFWKRVERRHRLQRHALNLGYKLTHESMFQSHAYHFLKNNKDVIKEYAGICDFREVKDDIGIVHLKMTVINNNKTIKHISCAETGQHWMLDHGIHEIEVISESSIHLGFSGIKYDPDQLSRFDNGEIYSNDQLFIESISVNGIDVTLTGFREVMPIRFQDTRIMELTDRNPRAIIGDALGEIIPNIAVKGWIRDKQFADRGMMRLLDRKLLDYIEEEFYERLPSAERGLQATVIPAAEHHRLAASGEAELPGTYQDP